MKTILYFQSGLCQSNITELNGVYRYAKAAKWRVQVVPYADAASNRNQPGGKDAIPQVEKLIDFWKPAGAIVDSGSQTFRFEMRECGAEWTLQYRFDDSGPREDYTEHNFGMVRRDRTPKPSFAAVAFMTRTVGEFTKVKHLPGDLTLKRAGEFTMPDGHKVYAAWAVVKDFEWTVPGDRPFRLYDMMGNELSAPADRRLVLTERPVYVFMSGEGK